MRKNQITPIAELGSRAPEAGRIRMGMKKAANTKSGFRPASIDTFRFTSPMKHLVEACAMQFGGVCKPWEKQWECISNTDSIPVVLLPGGISQNYELWSGGGCLRRCDGITVMVPTPISDYDYEMVAQDCICGARGERECSVKTRAQMIIPSLPFAGVWRLETSGFNAAEELPGMYEMIVALGERNMVQAILSTEMREKIVTTRKGPQTRRYVVPRFSMAQTVHELAAGQAGVASLGTGAPAQPAALPRGDVQSTNTAPKPQRGTESEGEYHLQGVDTKVCPDCIGDRVESDGKSCLTCGGLGEVLDDDITEGEIVTPEQLEVERELTECAEYFGLDGERFVRAVGRSVNSDLDRMRTCATKMRAGTLAPIGFKPDGGIEWQL